MKLQQDQLFKKGDEYIRIVKLERLAVDYKIIKDLQTREGIHLRLVKKEFCKLIKGATIVTPEEQKAILQSFPDHPGETFYKPPV
jgi:hypothetical protein